jgi:hypothetical protein
MKMILLSVTVLFLAGPVYAQTDSKPASPPLPSN